MRCPICKNEQERGRLCDKCGRDLYRFYGRAQVKEAHAKTEEDNDGPRCPSCGMPADDARCINCGERIPEFEKE